MVIGTKTADLIAKEIDTSRLEVETMNFRQAVIDDSRHLARFLNMADGGWNGPRMISYDQDDMSL